MGVPAVTLQVPRPPAQGSLVVTQPLASASQAAPVKPLVQVSHWPLPPLQLTLQAHAICPSLTLHVERPAPKPGQSVLQTSSAVQVPSL
jgi:hypothetical protein